MRWDRATLKQRAKNELRFSYWKSMGTIGIVMAISYAVMMVVMMVFVAVVLGSIAGPAIASGGNLSTADETVIITRMVIIYGVMLLVILPLSILVFNPLSAGTYKFSLEAPRGDRRVSNVFFAFKKGHYGTVTGGLFLRTLFMFLIMLVPMIISVVLAALIAIGAQNNSYGLSTLWMILSVVVSLGASVVSIIFYYRWCLVSFIVSDDPNAKGMEALRRSAAMTKGQRWELFVLDLSFLGWFLLGVFCMGVGTYFVMPYYLATWAQLYYALKGEVPEQTMAQQLPPQDPRGFYGQNAQQQYQHHNQTAPNAQP